MYKVNGLFNRLPRHKEAEGLFFFFFLSDKSQIMEFNTRLSVQNTKLRETFQAVFTPVSLLMQKFPYKLASVKNLKSGWKKRCFPTLFSSHVHVQKV